MAQGDRDVIVLASAARVAAPGAMDIYADGFRAVEVMLDLTAFTTAASLTLNLQVSDPVVGWVTVLSSAVIAAVGQTFLRFGLDAPEVANASRYGVLGRAIRVAVTHGNGNSHTYSVGARLG